MSENKRLIFTWLSLLALTLTSASFAETSTVNTATGVFVCLIIALKGRLVIDNLIGLRWTNKAIRGVMLSYFYILSLLIALGIVFPDFVVRMTTLGSS